MTLDDLLSQGGGEACAPLGRVVLPHFRGLAAVLRAQPDLSLLALWADQSDVFALLRNEATGSVAFVAAPAAGLVALDSARPVAAWFQRAIRDLHGHAAPDMADQRPWLDHGAWEMAQPLVQRPLPAPVAPPVFLPATGRSLAQIPVGPVHAGIIEPGHFRFHTQGETVVRLEARLGYTHKGTTSLMLGKPPRAAARFAARISGDTTVAHGAAFARAVEAATGTQPPPRAAALRQAMLELERIANHCGDAGAIINDCAFVALAAQFADLREQMLRATDRAFGHRLMMDLVVPGGLAGDLLPGGPAAIAATLDVVADTLPRLVRIMDSHASLMDRLVGTGVVSRRLADRFAAPGIVGRASGRARDTRAAEWPELDVAVADAGDVDARLRVRLHEVTVSVALLRTLLEGLPDGAIHQPVPAGPGEGLGVAEGFRGECWHWVRLDGGGLIEGCHAADPSWRLWPLLEAAALGNIVADFPLINKSINASYSGVDL